MSGMGAAWLDAMNIEDRIDGYEEDAPMVMTKRATVDVPIDMRIEDLVRFAMYLGLEEKIQQLRDMTQEELVDYAERFWEAQHGED